MSMSDVTNWILDGDPGMILALGVPHHHLVLEALLEYEAAVGDDTTLEKARSRANEYYLERRLMYSLSTGELFKKRWLLMSFPPRWHYDVLRGLDYLRVPLEHIETLRVLCWYDGMG